MERIRLQQQDRYKEKNRKKRDIKVLNFLDYDDSVYDALKMSAELRMSLVYALTNPEEFYNEVNQV